MCSASRRLYIGRVTRRRSIAVVATVDGCSQAHDRNFVIYMRSYRSRQGHCEGHYRLHRVVMAKLRSTCCKNWVSLDLITKLIEHTVNI